MQRLSICFFLIFLGASLGLGSAALLQAAKSIGKINSTELVAGKSMQLFEKKFDETLQVRDIARDAWGIFEYVLFQQGRKNIVIGQNGWLFSAEEYAWPKDARKNIESNLAYIEAATSEITKGGIPFKIVLIPSKVRLFEKELKYAAPMERTLLYDDILQSLIRKNMPVQDLRITLAENNSFFKTDTHWTSLGALHAAESLFEQNKPAIELSDAPTHQGDLLKYLPLGALVRHFGYEPEKNKTLNIIASTAVSEASLFDASGPELHLIGTSYSANDAWGFAKALEAASKMSVVNFAQEGQGPFSVMKDYLAKTDISKPKMIVWEIPERYFPYPFKGPQK